MASRRGRDNVQHFSNKNMRNLDNQMMLYFSDKSLIFKLYYYILVNTYTQTQTRDKNGKLLIYTEKNNTYIETLGKNPTCTEGNLHVKFINFG